MSITGKVLLGVGAVVFIAAIPIMSNVAREMGEMPSRTPINVPTALKKSTEADKSYADTNGKKETEFVLYFIALEDNGKTGKKIGCNDSLVPAIYSSSSQAGPSPKERIAALLQIKEMYYKKTGLYNSLYQSNLTVEKIEESSDGVSQVFLNGNFQLNGVCDEPRVLEQLIGTIKQGNESKKVEIYLNGNKIKNN